jgi:hypothetical protein
MLKPIGRRGDARVRESAAKRRVPMFVRRSNRARRKYLNSIDASTDTASTKVALTPRSNCPANAALIVAGAHAALRARRFVSGHRETPRGGTSLAPGDGATPETTIRKLQTRATFEGRLERTS